jgi:hypothetical protein
MLPKFNRIAPDLRRVLADVAQGLRLKRRRSTLMVLSNHVKYS